MLLEVAVKNVEFIVVTELLFEIVNAEDVIETFTVEVPKLILEELEDREETESETAITVEFVTAFAVLLPTSNAEEFTVKLDPIAIVEAFTVEIPILKSTGVKFAVKVELETLNRELVCVVFAVLLPTKNILEFTTTLLPTTNSEEREVPKDVTLELKVTLPDTLAVPVIVSVASGDELFIPTRFKSPSATIKSVLTTKPFLTTKSFSAIMVPFPLLAIFFYL